VPSCGSTAVFVAVLQIAVAAVSPRRLWYLDHHREPRTCAARRARGNLVVVVVHADDVGVAVIAPAAMTDVEKKRRKMLQCCLG